MKWKKILSQLLKKPESEIETLESAEGDELESAVTARLAAVRQESIDRGLSDLQKKLNKIATDKGLTLPETPTVENVVALIESNASGKEPQISEEIIKSSQVFKDAEAAHRTREAELVRQHTEALKAEKDKISIEKLRGKAMIWLEEAGYDIPENPTLRANLVDGFMKDLTNGLSYSEDDTGEPKEFFRNGKRVENEQLYPLTGLELVSQSGAKWFPTKEDKRDAPPDPNKKPISSGKVLQPKDIESLNKILQNDAYTEDEKIAANTYYGDFVKGGRK